MTKAVPRGIPGWALFRGSEVKGKGPALAAGQVLEFHN